MPPATVVPCTSPSTPMQVGTKLAGNETYITGLIEALAAVDCENRYTLYVTKSQAVRKFAIAGPTSSYAAHFRTRLWSASR